jgi:parvulin-like peptidyl-prolyl isomerase
MKIYYSAVSEGDMRAIKLRLFEQVIDRHILTQEARREGLRLTQSEVDAAFRDSYKEMPEDFLVILRTQGVSAEAWKRKLLQEKLVQKLVKRQVNDKVRVSNDKVRDYYWGHLQDYWLADAVRARHLIVQRKQRFDQVMAALKKGGDFSKIAETFSQEPGSAQGGDWHYMETDRLPPIYLNVLSKLTPGEISKPVKDDFGYHLFQLIEWRPRRMRTLAEVQDQIHEELLKRAQDEAFDQWVLILKKKAKIKVKQDVAPVVGAALEGQSGK